VRLIPGFPRKTKTSVHFNDDGHGLQSFIAWRQCEMTTKITVKDDQGKQLVSIEYDPERVQDIRIGSPMGTIEVTGGEPVEEGERR
jgi:hypothetical protein